MAQDSKAIRVSIPVSVAGNIMEFKGAIGNILDKLGCPACCSGYDILFSVERDFIVDENAVVSSARSRVISTKNAPTISATLSPKVANDINLLNDAVDRIADRLGCQACCSGNDLRFQMERDFILGK